MPPPTVKIETYRAAAGRIIGAALTSDRAYSRLAHLTDHIGNRLSGSKNLERAIEWAVAEMKRDALDNVRAEKVMVPHWVRGEESLEMLTPVPENYRSWDWATASALRPKASLLKRSSFATLPSSIDLASRYAERSLSTTCRLPITGLRLLSTAGASRAARYGAVAALVRSITPVSLQTPHTGAMNYDANQPKIPVAAVTIEVAEFLQRMNDRGDHPKLRLKMEAKFLPDAESANVIAELKGSEKPDEVIVIGGHFDSWDVGQGAHDDGGGCIVAWEAVRLLKELGLRPRRTIRVVLYTNEENGLRGGNAYRDAHRAEIAKHILAIESDSGVYRPEGFGLEATAPLQARSNMLEIAKLLSGIGADQIAADGGGADIGPITREGVVGASLDVDGTHYFDIHHTPADTLDKVNPRELALCVATMAVMAYTVADMPESFE